MRHLPGWQSSAAANRAAVHAVSAARENLPTVPGFPLAESRRPQTAARPPSGTATSDTPTSNCFTTSSSAAARVPSHLPARCTARVASETAAVSAAGLRRPTDARGPPDGATAGLRSLIVPVPMRRGAGVWGDRPYWLWYSTEYGSLIDINK